MSDCPEPLETPLVCLDKLPYIQKEIKKNSILYNIKIYNANTSIIISIKSINDFLEINYKNEYTLQQLYQKDDCFASFNSIEKLYNNVFENYNKEIIILENEYKINLIFKFVFFNNIKEIIFNFDESNLNMRNSFFKLFNKIKEISKINENLGEKIENNRNEIEQLKKKLEEEKIFNLNEKIKKLENKLSVENKRELNEINTNNFFKISNILFIIIIIIYGGFTLTYFNKDNDIQFLSIKKKFVNMSGQFQLFNNNISKIDIKLKSFTNDINLMRMIIYININNFNIIKSLINKGINKYFNKEIKSSIILYQASKDGFNSKNFHQKCDGKSFTVTVVITAQDKIFGGFTELKWDRSGKTKYGDKGFLFSISNNDIYYNKEKYSIFGADWLGPYFDYGFIIDGQIGYDYTDYYNSFSGFKFPKENYVLAKEHHFLIKDYIVFQIGI